MENSYFERQDAFVTEMIAAYDQGQMPAIVKPYMDWREARVMISRLAEVDSRNSSLKICLYNTRYTAAFRPYSNKSLK